jgi:hypothetical protein
MTTELRRALAEVEARSREVRFRGALALGFLGMAIIGIGAAVALGQPGIETRPLGFLIAWPVVVGLATLAIAWPILRSKPEPRLIALRIEARYPELKTGLLAAIDEDDATLEGRGSYLRSAVIRQALAHREQHDWLEAATPSWKVRAARLASWLSLALLVVVSVAMVVQGQRHNRAAVEYLAAHPEAAHPGDPTAIQVEPGNVEIEKGTPLLVVARFNGSVPPEVSLVVEEPSQASTSKPMARALEDPTFAGRVESVATNLSYRVQFAGRSSETFQVKVFEYPEVRRTDARLDFPDYTAIETKIVEDIRHVTAVEGTDLTLTFHLNKPVVEANLVDDKGQVTPLKALPEGENLYASTFTLTDSHRYKVLLKDKEGRSSKVPAEVAVNVTRNKPATVAVAQPARDVRVSPVEELTLKANVADDFGVVRHGLAYSIAGEEPKEVELAGSNAKPSPKKIKAEHLLAFEALKAQPDQLVTYFFWAEDIGPDGQPRRTSGDMYFAEVRHFEEIFRQGEEQSSAQQEQQQQQQQNGAAQKAEELAELQKQVINATWKLVRRETRSKPTEAFAEDVKTIAESQKAAIEQAEALTEQLQDETSKENLATAIDKMKAAEKHLSEAASSNAIKGLSPSLASEQAAYQALLKLRAREFEVTRQQRQQRQQSSSSSASQRQQQQQLDQLELKSEENRYEQQNAARAQTQQQQEQQENRQVANRLKELAQRQADLNTRLKELQSALEAAKEKEAREEIERQLKRLREQQQQVLRDTDELQERMEREENRERMAEERQQVEQARENVRQASEALEEGRLSQAINEGTRAQRQMDEVRDEIRKKSSDRFAQDMTEMRSQARQLDEKQAQLAEQLETKDRQAQRSLRDADNRQALHDGLEGQQAQLDKLMDRMRDTVQEAEETEPLLAKQLFDTVKKANDQAIPSTLKQAEQLADVGINEEAAKSARQAAQGISQIREGVDKAAKSVLGDETQALKRAQAELEDLTRQINREVARNDNPNPDEIPAQPGQQPQRSRGQGQQGQEGQPGQDGQQPGQQGRQRGQQGEQGQGQQEQGEQRQRGQGQQGQGQQEQGQQGEGQQGQQGQGQQRQRGQGQQEQGQQGQQEQGQGQQGQGQQGQQGQGQQGQGQQGQGQQGQGQQGQQGQGQQGQGQEGQQGQQGQGQGQQGQGQQGQGQEGQGQQGQGQGQGQQGQGQQGQGQQGQGQQGGGRQGGQQQGGMRQAGSPGGRGGDREGLERMLEGGNDGGVGGGGAPGGPITGEGFRQWSDRMRDVEELLEDPQLRAEAARIRDRARGAREEFKRHSKTPDPKALKEMVADPIRELRDRVAEEVRRRESPDSLVPIDRDPVPTQFTEGVRRYYERIGSGK